MANLPLFHSQELMAGNNKIFKLVIFLFLGLLGLQSQAADYLKIQPKKGDGIGVILNRYELASFDCNKDSFMMLNNLKEGDFLILSKWYKLPVYVFEYNGTSIRSTVGIEDYGKAIRIQAYNEKMLELGLRDEDFRKNKVLWVPFHEMYCSDDLEIEPISSVGVDDDASSEIDHKETADDEDRVALKYEIFPIFGKEYERTPIYSTQLEGHVYYLISGHGGPDPGAMTSKDGHLLCEDEYAYDVTLRLARNLLQHSATVYMITRDDDGIRDQEYLESDKDETVWFNQEIPLNHVKRLKQRSAKVNELYEKHKKEGAKVQRVIEIHIDSRYEESKVDIFFYYYPGSEQGKALADQMLSTIKSEYEEHQKNRGYKGVVKSRDLHTLRESKPPVVYIELGNITNSFDQRRLLIVNNRQAIANWLAQGIMTYQED
ncbi:N-acetylmuramoyl-L-alanine amidase [bacterium]|nr:N-acetylmuramoyl-L-alanine amidase [bacterium]